MKTFKVQSQSLTPLFALFLLFLSQCALAGLVEVPPSTARVTDLTQTLSAEQTQYLETKLAKFEQEKGSQIAILIVPTTQPEDIPQFANRVAMQWQLGRKKEQDGVLILVAKNDRRMRVEVDSGLQGAIPDVIAKRIISEIIAPHFRRGDYLGGLDQATSQIMALISGESLPKPVAKKQTASVESLLPVLLIGGFVLGGILRSIFGAFFGGALNGGAIGFLAWLLGGSLLTAAIFAVVAFFIALMSSSGVGSGFGRGGYYGGGGGGWSSSGGRDVFSGGGSQGWSGGGASGDW
jgi:uncharacterized protein